MLEMSKIVPQLLWKFEVGLQTILEDDPTATNPNQFRLADPNREWKLENRWFVKQTGFHVFITERQRTKS